jgi:hypothetical protein
LLQYGRAEWERFSLALPVKQLRNRDVPPLELPSSAQAKIDRQHRDELRVREFCETHDLLTFPSWLQHYWKMPMPAYLADMTAVGVSDDLTGPDRLDQNGVSYTPPTVAGTADVLSLGRK